MAEKRRLNLSFSMASPLQRKAWSLLCAVPSGRRTDAVCRAVCQAQEHDNLLETIRRIIREELHNVDLHSQTGKTEQLQKTGDVDDNVLDFLQSLQGNE